MKADLIKLCREIVHGINNIKEDERNDICRTYSSTVNLCYLVNNDMAIPTETARDRIESLHNVLIMAGAF